MIPRRQTSPGLGRVIPPAAESLPSLELELDRPDGLLEDTRPCTPYAALAPHVLTTADADDARLAEGERPKSGIRVRPPLVSEEVTARRDARWEKD